MLKAEVGSGGTSCRCCDAGKVSTAPRATQLQSVSKRFPHFSSKSSHSFTVTTVRMILMVTVGNLMGRSLSRQKNFTLDGMLPQVICKRKFQFFFFILHVKVFPSLEIKKTGERIIYLVRCANIY